MDTLCKQFKNKCNIIYNKDTINIRIKNEICYNTINKLNNNNLMEEFINSKSVKLKIKQLEEILKNNIIEEKKINLIINEYLPELIPAATKAVIRGNNFNKIIKNKILEMKLDEKIYEINFEKQYENMIIEEIPDFYIYNKINNKLIIGMNSLDLWSGGMQLNRGFKYIMNNKYNTNKSKLLCIVCNDVILKSEKNKIFKLLKIGFENNTITYINNLNNIIENYFNLDID
jgi:hypothetical protein